MTHTDTDYYSLRGAARLAMSKHARATVTSAVCSRPWRFALVSGSTVQAARVQGALSVVSCGRKGRCSAWAAISWEGRGGRKGRWQADTSRARHLVPAQPIVTSLSIMPARTAAMVRRQTSPPLAHAQLHHHNFFSFCLRSAAFGMSLWRDFMLFIFSCTTAPAFSSSSLSFVHARNAAASISFFLVA